MKCKNCGAEVPSGEEKCPYCHCEMPKEKQEVHITNNYYRNTEGSSDEATATTSTCPKCGSNKIKFKREEIGSTNANVNKGKREVHYRTVGVCQNCGFTYDANPTPEKKKKHGFWWWVLVICFFPISVPFLLSKWFLKTDKIKLDKKIKIAIVAVFWILYLVLIFAGGGKNESTTTADTSVESTIAEKETETEVEKEKETEEPKETETPKETEAPKETQPDVPTEYLSAIVKAETYSEMMHMSKQGIYDQLTSEYGEKFSSEAAEWAMENLKVDYNENALAKAKDYSDTMHMSKQGIYDQLTSEYGEKFTEDEAQYAVDNLIADYNENALAKAKDYQNTMNMSPTAIHDQLTSEYGEKFTTEEADYAISHLE